MSSSSFAAVQNRTSIDELITTIKTTLFDIKPQYGTSIIRDVITTANGGTVTTSDGEILVNTNTTGTSSAILDTVQRGVYISGKSAEWGIGIRYATNPTGSQSIIWGLGDASNGFYHGVDATSRFVRLRRGGSDTTIRQSNWSLDKLDGTGRSGINLADYANRGLIYQCEFTWYGYGGITWKILIPTPLEDKLISVHHERPGVGLNSTIDPNLPLRVQVENGGTATALTAAVGGRQYSVYGEFIPQSKITSEFRDGVSTSNGLWFPVMVWRLKSTLNGRTNSVSCAPRSYTASSTDRTHLVGIFIEDTGVITTGTFGQPSNTPTLESALEVNKTATGTYTPSANAYRIYISSLEKNVPYNDPAIQELDKQFFSLPPNKHMVFAAQPVDGNGSLTVSTMNVRELR